MNARSISSRFLAVSLAASLGSAGLVACQADPSPAPGQGDPFPSPMNDPEITVIPIELRSWLGFQSAVIVRDGERPMQVQVPVRNLAERKYLLEYRFLFYDDNGLELSPQMGWQMFALDAKQVQRLSGAALDLRARTYRLEVRWSQ